MPRLVIRVDQVGYPATAKKTALVLAPRKTGRLRFEVVDDAGKVVLQGRLGRSRGGWSSRWPAVYPLDFSNLRRGGRYRVVVGGVESQSFSVAAARDLYGRVAGSAVKFFEAQRDGPRVIRGQLGRVPSHLSDRRALVYSSPHYRRGRLVGSLRRIGGPVDASGGWFDAGDYTKLVETASFVDVLMLFTARDYGDAVPDRAALLGEARFGTDWLLKMWDQRRRVLYYQVGLGNGNRSIIGDHDLWRRPESDDSRTARPGQPLFFIRQRPVLAANLPGKRISPNLAGRTAAAFGLCAQVFATTDAAYARRCLVAGQTLYDRAETRVTTLLTTSPHDYYDEVEWRDDLELGAVELYLAGLRVSPAGLPHPRPERYVQLAGRWADAYMNSPFNGEDRLNLYDVSALGHYDLSRALESSHFRRLNAVESNLDVPTDASSLRADLLSQLRSLARLGSREPFRVAGDTAGIDPVPHTLGAVIEAGLYASLTGQSRFDSLARSHLDWVLGENPWGVSYVVGAGSVFPRCLSHQIANLSGSLGGWGKLLVGATVDGPSPESPRPGSPPAGLRPCRRELQSFDGHGLHYVDDAAFPVTSEPADDYSALALTALAQRAMRDRGT